MPNPTRRRISPGPSSTFSTTKSRRRTMAELARARVENELGLDPPATGVRRRLPRSSRRAAMIGLGAVEELISDGPMKQVAQNYRTGELTVLDSADTGVSPGRGACPLALLTDLDRDRAHEGAGGQALPRRQGQGPSRSSPPGPRHGGATGAGGCVQEGHEPARLLHPIGVLAVRGGGGGRARSRGVQCRSDGRLRRQRTCASRRVELGTGQPMRPGPGQCLWPSRPRSRPWVQSPCTGYGNAEPSWVKPCAWSA